MLCCHFKRRAGPYFLGHWPRSTHKLSTLRWCCCRVMRMNGLQAHTTALLIPGGSIWYSDNSGILKVVSKRWRILEKVPSGLNNNLVLDLICQYCQTTQDRTIHLVALPLLHTKTTRYLSVRNICSYYQYIDIFGLMHFVITIDVYDTIQLCTKQAKNNLPLVGVLFPCFDNLR